MSFHILSRSLLISVACMLVMHAYATPTPNNDSRSSVSVKVPSNVTARAAEGVPATNEKRTTVSTEECSEEQIAIIELSAAAADAYAAESYDYMKHSHGEHARYVWWFGPWSQRRLAPNEEERVRTHVKNAYKAMTARSFVSGYTYDCDCEFEVIAFVDGARYNQRPRPVINLCNRF